MEKIISERSIVPACRGRKGELLALWEQSVRVSHTFLKEADIKALFPFVSEALEKVGRLLCICNEAGQAEAFMGVEGDKLEMLFVHPLSRGKGIGKLLVRHAIQNLEVCYVDVNEQNLLALGFYQYMGFRVYDRSALDGQGNPFPLLHMKLEK